MASSKNTVDNNMLAIQLYHSQVGETAAAAASNPTNAVDSTTSNPDDSSITIFNNNADSTTGWTWMWPDIRTEEGRKSSLLLDVKKGLIKQIQKTLKDDMLDRFRLSCFGAYLHYPPNPVPSAVMHLMISQQVIKEGADEDELWFLVGDKFVRLSKQEYALVTGLRFGPTSFDPNADCECSNKGVFRKFVDPDNNYGKKGAPYTDVLKLFQNPRKALRRSPEDLLKIAKVLFVHGFFYATDARHHIAKWLWVLVEKEDEWENFPWGSYSFQIFIMRMKNLKPGERSYHFYGFSHAFLHFVFEAVPGLAAKVTSKPTHKLVRPRLIKRVFNKCSSLDELVKFFDTEEPIKCYEKLEPTEKELKRYGSWWHHVADDVRLHVKYIHRESHFTKSKELKRTREQSNVGEREQGDGSVPTGETGPPNNSVPAFGIRPTKRPRTTESPNVDPDELFTRIMEGVRRDNELLVERVMLEVREKHEMASQKADDMRSEIGELRKMVEELRRPDEEVPVGEYAKYYSSQFENTLSPSPPICSPPPPETQKTPPPPEAQKTPPPPEAQKTPAQKTPLPPLPPPETQKAPSPPLPSTETQITLRPPEIQKTTPADDLFVPFESDFLDEIAAFSDAVEYSRARGKREPLATPFVRGRKVFSVRPAVRPAKATDKELVSTDEEMASYLKFLFSSSQEWRDIGNILPETNTFFKDIENTEKSEMETQAVDAYLRILNFNPEFLGRHHEGEGKFTILGHFFCESIEAIWSPLHNLKKNETIPLPKSLGNSETLDASNEQVKTLLSIVLGETPKIAPNWGKLVPFTDVQKIYTVWLGNGHFYPLIIDLVKCEVWIFDSMAVHTNKEQRVNRYLHTISLRRILPAILELSNFYIVRKELKPVKREWDLRFADKGYCFKQDLISSCGPFALKLMEVLASRRALPFITEDKIGLIRRSIAERIFSHSSPAENSIPLFD